MCFCGSTVRPKILWIKLDLNPWRLVCEAEAKPSPNIMWLNPRGVRVVGSKITVGTITHQDNIQNVSFLNLTEDDPEGNYTCLVKNKYGNVTETVIFNIPSSKAPEEVLWFDCLVGHLVPHSSCFVCTNPSVHPVDLIYIQVHLFWRVEVKTKTRIVVMDILFYFISDQVYNFYTDMLIIIWWGILINIVLLSLWYMSALHSKVRLLMIFHSV